MKKGPLARNFARRGDGFRSIEFLGFKHPASPLGACLMAYLQGLLSVAAISLFYFINAFLQSLRRAGNFLCGFKPLDGGLPAPFAQLGLAKLRGDFFVDEIVGGNFVVAARDRVPVPAAASQMFSARLVSLVALRRTAVPVQIKYRNCRDCFANPPAKPGWPRQDYASAGATNMLRTV